jgi:plasmid stabilization system protein ParE
MDYEIVWSPVAKTSYFTILEYLEKNWTAKEIQAFVNRTEEILDLIKTRPSLFQYSKSSDTYRCVLVKQVSLFYRTRPSTNRIELLLFWDNRQNPEKLGF